jgi:2-hydroxy-3-keto-5-methylthiopentenyl-1-phosphate phosphatase
MAACRACADLSLSRESVVSAKPVSNPDSCAPAPAPNTARVLVSDFDGTMTRHDFYDLVRRRWPVPPDDDPWEHYVAGRLTHFEALAAIFARIRTDERSLLGVAEEMELDPDLPRALTRLRQHGWEVVVASAGCAWYIDYLLRRAGVTLTVHANPGRYVAGAGLQMSLPEPSRFLSRTTGIDKSAVVRDALERAAAVAFAGDGRPDREPALLVPATRRFARGWLAGQLRSDQQPFQSFDRWSQIADSLASTLC